MSLDRSSNTASAIKKKNKAFFIDTYSEKSSHEMFNASLMLMCAIVFDQVDCRMGQSAYENYLKIIKTRSPENIVRKRTFVVAGNGRISLVLRYLVSAFQNIKYLLISPKDAVLIFPFNNLFSLAFINTLNKIYKRKILIFCHSEMEGIGTDEKKGGYFHRQLTALCRNFFLNPKTEISETLYFSVLGDVLKSNIAENIGLKKASKFISIDHAYFFEPVQPTSKAVGKLSLATVGSISKTKGLLEFFEFAKHLSTFSTKIKLAIIGTTHEDLNLFNGTNIELQSESNTFLDREEFKNKIQELDYVLFFYHKDNYRITASGAVMDAISYEKPILALKNDYFEYLFNKYGQFGHLFDNVEEMANLVKDLSVNNLIKPFDFKCIKVKLTPEVISQQMYAELRRVNFLTI
ncbi:glycosyltransferase [Pedobacter sp. KBS0701]|uniref:glycosyltransferase n=1 Tax=Pedobacter sp. KBS0701 TaxID=2578106 RepID=UPI00110E2F1C|nr:glycosyltransferase [Pedobacter sp. KBS0701]QDW26943.1 glycosyltransferase [Pedobacter sp. KBS0701]